MHDETYTRILENPSFKNLVSQRNRFAWTLSVIMLGLYVAFIMLIAFDPQVLGARISETSPMTLGMPLGVGLILAAFVLTGIYVKRANGEFDRLTQEVLEEVGK